MIIYQSTPGIDSDGNENQFPGSPPPHDHDPAPVYSPQLQSFLRPRMASNDQVCRSCDTNNIPVPTQDPRRSALHSHSYTCADPCTRTDLRPGRSLVRETFRTPGLSDLSSFKHFVSGNSFRIYGILPESPFLPNTPSHVTDPVPTPIHGWTCGPVDPL